MAKLNCLKPIPAYIQHYYLRGVRKDKVRLFKAEDYIKKRKPDVLIPCRECKACRLNERNRWIGRITEQATNSKRSYFLTLTYKENPLKLIYRDVQLFFKRLRKEYKEELKYFVVGEYGEKKGRPHWHIIIHGIEIKDLKFFKLSSNGAYYLSENLERIWGNGFILVSEFSEAVARYVAGYVTKKYDEELLIKVSKGYGMNKGDDVRLLQTFTRGNGSGLTSYEKQLLRKKYGNTYYYYADKIRAETKLQIEEEWAKRKRRAEIEKIYKRITTPHMR